ncbi:MULTISPECIES: GntR family transcriptional regulator [unclassified Nonomuraea]|uniref:GntR family transcriptional regulator n=1 Tax=unclassified Nonomuraea TaxID=2593643 RepID=UPI00340FBF6A
MAIDPLDPTPLWEQLAAIVREQIQAGDLQPRQLVPSESALQNEYDVSRGTVRRAMAALGEEGWVVTIQGRGTYVAPQESWPKDE